MTSLATRLPGPTQLVVGRRAAASCLPAFLPCGQSRSQGAAGAGTSRATVAAAAARNGKPWTPSPGSLPPLPYSVASVDDALASLDSTLPTTAPPLPVAGEEGALHCAQQSSRAPWWDELSSSESDSEHGLEPWRDDPYWTPDRPGLCGADGQEDGRSRRSDRRPAKAQRGPSTMATVTDPVTGVAFPAQQAFWKNGMLTCVGAGVRVKKVGFLSIKAYAVCQYIDIEAASAATSKPGCEAAAQQLLQGGAFTRVLQMHMVRDVTGDQFSQTLDEVMRPLMQGDSADLDAFCAFLSGHPLTTGTQITFMRHADGSLDVCVRAAGDTTPYNQLQPGLTITAPRLGDTLWSLFLAPKGPTPEARKAWLEAVAKLGA
ncbi:chalcone isomerase [Chlorella sorokiniana]|uniref:Chalcone isomerase n=1 Tax=Chlorella sorokiniana TaxID=3076 RepID=A0A2P6THC7_CHLSO|nr:chalcone isomerase [Chlorella sorokiniana]|eukprot:PRW33697.1 chalcone isomerase [Chlorella sorokiniana]